MRKTTASILRVLIVVLIISGSSANSFAAPSGTDFPSVCSVAGVIKCVGFDAGADIVGGDTSNSGLLSGATVNPVIDSTVKSSGHGSLKFTVPSQSGPAASGAYFTMDDLSGPHPDGSAGQR